MKSKMVVLVISVALCASLLGADKKTDTLELTDGRVLHNWRITRESGAYVTVLFKGGIAQVPKWILPEPLRSKYPLDKQAIKAAQESAQAVAEADRVRTQRAAELRRQENLRNAVAVQESRSVDQAAAPREAERHALYARIYEAARGRADKYFRYEYEPSSSSRIYTISVAVDADDPEPWAGIPGRYTVKGKGYLAYYNSRYTGFDRSTKEFTVFLEVTEFSVKAIEIRAW